MLNIFDKEIGWKVLWKLPKSSLWTVLSSAPNGPNLIPFQNQMCSTAEIFPATDIWGWFNLDHIYISLLVQSVVEYSHLQVRDNFEVGSGVRSCCDHSQIMYSEVLNGRSWWSCRCNDSDRVGQYEVFWNVFTVNILCSYRVPSSPLFENQKLISHFNAHLVLSHSMSLCKKEVIK